MEALGALTLEGAALLATVKGSWPRDRRQVLAGLARERLPAALVTATSREAGDQPARRTGAAAFSVFLASRSLRSDDEARLGSAEAAGVFTLAEAVGGALHGMAVGDDRRVWLVEERAACGEANLLVWEQRYEVRREAAGPAPTFGGVALAGLESDVQVELGPARRAVSSFSFPGIDGVFERSLGLRGREIVWRGQLRVANDAAMNLLEAGIEGAVSAGQAATLIDTCGRSHLSCVARSFKRTGSRQRDELTGDALQGFELVFAQAGGS